MNVPLYSDPIEAHAPEEVKSPLTREEEEFIERVRAVEQLRGERGWKVLTDFLKAQREVVFTELANADDQILIARLQGAVRALNLFFGTVEALCSEASFLRQIQARPSEE